METYTPLLTHAPDKENEPCTFLKYFSKWKLSTTYNPVNLCMYTTTQPISLLTRISVCNREYTQSYFLVSTKGCELAHKV